ncbi:MAG: glycerol-3-phosphate dehydrogenase, partial [Gammaproteobacteria bacterium]|nr:glycerol-3-phosphate dehydrogenase [Gammaproteobacteria bacterium]
VKKPKNVRLVRGSHIIVDKIFKHDKSYIFQNPDGRIIFAIPYEKKYTLIGTTDKDHGDKVDSVKIDSEELQYLCDSANAYFKNHISGSDVIWSYSGVRPLYDDGATKAQQATRDYVVKTETKEQSLLINIFGGKITTYRQLSETILKHIEEFLGQRGPAWTEQAQLPGGNFEVGKLHDLIRQLQTRYPFLGNREVNRFARTYGTMSKHVLGEAKSLADLGKHFGAGLYQAEIEYLVANELATTSQDILFRRTKLGVGLPKNVANEIDSFLRAMEIGLYSANRCAHANSKKHSTQIRA